MAQKLQHVLISQSTSAQGLFLMHQQRGPLPAVCGFRRPKTAPMESTQQKAFLTGLLLFIEFFYYL